MYVSKGEETKVYSLVELLKGGRKKKTKNENLSVLYHNSRKKKLKKNKHHSHPLS